MFGIDGEAIRSVSTHAVFGHIDIQQNFSIRRNLRCDFEFEVGFAKRGIGRTQSAGFFIRNFCTLLNNRFDVVARDHARIGNHFAFAIGLQSGEFKIDETGQTRIKQSHGKCSRIGSRSRNSRRKINHRIGNRGHLPNTCGGILPAQTLQTVGVATKHHAAVGSRGHLNEFTRIGRVWHIGCAHAASVIKAQFHTQTARKRVFRLDNARFYQDLLLKSWART